MINHRWAIASVAALSLTALSGCAGANSQSSKTSQPTPTPASSSASAQKGSEVKPVIYASTDVWASVARQVAGDNATVTTSIDNPTQDPHDYEATVKDKQAVNEAKIAIINGGGYDDWAKKLVESAPNKPVLLDAVQISGLQKAEGGKAEGEFNEHVFYSLPTVKKVAAQIADQLAKLDASKADTFKNNESDFDKQIDSLMKTATKYAKPDIHSVSTEPVVGYLLEEMHIQDVTPDEFVEQSETEAGPSVKLQDETVHLLTDHKAQILVLNAQTEDPVSDRLAQAAKAANAPIVKVYETFPAGVNNYVTWVKNAIDSLGDAVAKVSK